MKLEGTNLLDTVSETAFLTREKAGCLLFFAAITFRYMNADAENGNNWVKEKNALLLPDSILYPRQINQYRTFYLYESNTRMVKEVNS